MSVNFPEDASLDALKNIFKQAYLAGPEVSRSSIPTGQMSPVAQMAEASPVLSYVRQMLPEKIRSNAWYTEFLRQLPEGDQGSWAELQRKVANKVGELPLGGFPQEVKDDFSARRKADPELRLRTVEYGKVPTVDNLTQASVGSNLRPQLAQAAGVTAADVSRDGARNIWWFLNAPQAVSQIAALQALHSAGEPIAKAEGLTSPFLIRNKNLRLAATLPSVIAMSTAVGNIGRPAGYKAVVPSAEDPRKTDSGTAEAISRYFLGRTGRLLPFNEFTKERPDVSKGEYERYKAYLFNKKTDLNPLDGDINVLGALRATTDGIHGPEVNFMGKTIPVLTGVMPSLAAAAGIRKGVRQAGRRIKERGDFRKAGEVKGRLEAAQVDLKQKQDNKAIQLTGKQESDLKSKINELTVERKRIDDSNQIETFKQALAYGGGYTAAAAISGQALESVRRTMGEENYNQS